MKLSKPWFTPKDYGWGWQPSTWQGWLVLVTYLAGAIFLSINIDGSGQSDSDILIGFFIPFIGLTVALIVVCAVTGEKPFWRWAGKRVSAAFALGQTAALIGSVLIAQLAGAIGALGTSPNLDWYETLTKPAWNPPSWLFGPVWIALYLMMGVAAYIVWYNRKNSSNSSKALWLYATQLALNTLWSFLFFSFHNLGLAAIEIIIMWIVITLTIRAFIKISRVAGWLLIPYIIWVSFATVLTITIWYLN